MEASAVGDVPIGVIQDSRADIHAFLGVGVSEGIDWAHESAGIVDSFAVEELGARALEDTGLSCRVSIVWADAGLQAEMGWMVGEGAVGTVSHTVSGPQISVGIIRAFPHTDPRVVLGVASLGDIVADLHTHLGHVVGVGEGHLRTLFDAPLCGVVPIG